MLKPTLLVSEMFRWDADRPGIHREIVERIAPLGFYRGLETAVVPDASERRELRALCEKHDLTLLQWLTKTLLDRNISLSSVDDGERREAVQCAKDCIDLAHDAGAFGIGLVSGADPGEALRTRAQQSLAESMREIAGYLGEKGMTLVIETLDRDRHKKQVLGPTAEGVDLIRMLRTVNPNCGLCWDSAHVALMGEDFRDSLACAAGSALQMHFANAVLDPASYFYGDHHIGPGEPGFLTLDKAEETLRLLRETGAAHPDGITRVGMESRTLPGNDPWSNEHLCREFLQNAFEKAKENAQ